MYTRPSHNFLTDTMFIKGANFFPCIFLFVRTNYFSYNKFDLSDSSGLSLLNSLTTSVLKLAFRVYCLLYHIFETVKNILHKSYHVGNGVDDYLKFDWYLVLLLDILDFKKPGFHSFESFTILHWNFLKL